MLSESLWNRIKPQTSVFDSHTKTIITRRELIVDRAKRPFSVHELHISPSSHVEMRKSRSKENVRAPMPPPRYDSPLRIFGETKRKRNSDSVDSGLFRVESGRLIARNVPENIAMDDLRIFFEDRDKCGGGEVESIKRGSMRKEVIIQYKHQSGEISE